MPGAFSSSGGGVPNTVGIPVVRSFTKTLPPSGKRQFNITLTCQDAVGTALVSATVFLFRTADNSVAAQGTSDANGSFTVGASNAITHYAVIYKVQGAGLPDVFGSSVNTLTGS